MMDKTLQKFPEHLYTNIDWNPSVLLLDFSDTQCNTMWAKWGKLRNETYKLGSLLKRSTRFVFSNVYFCVMYWWLFMWLWPHRNKEVLKGRKVCSGSQSEGTQPTVVGAAWRQKCEGTGHTASTVRNQGDKRKCVLAKMTTKRPTSVIHFYKEHPTLKPDLSWGVSVQAFRQMSLWGHFIFKPLHTI